MQKKEDDVTKVQFSQIFESTDTQARRTKIICTLGPACWDVEMLVKMLDAGMDVARIDMQHYDHKQHEASISNLKEALKLRPDKVCGIILDTKGPEIKTGMLKDNKPVELVANQELMIITDISIEGDVKRLSCNYKSLPQSVHIGQEIFIDEGQLTCEVVEILDAGIKVICKNSHKLGERKDIILPGAILDLPPLTEVDEENIVEFGLKNDIDFISCSLVRKASDIDTVRDILGPRGQKLKVISKIQNTEGLQNFDEILAVSDGIIICRQSLGFELQAQKVFIAQKWMIEKANIAAKPIIIQDQVLNSMIKSPRPSRAEAGDIATSIQDGTDAVLLDRETANGDYPINCVNILAKICCESEKTFDNKKYFNDIKMYTPVPYGTAESCACAAVQSILELNIDMVIVLTEQGKLARLVSKFKPNVPILCCSPHAHVVKQVNACSGVMGFKIPSLQGQDGLLQFIIKKAKDMRLCRQGNKIISIQGSDEDTPQESNVMKIVDIE